jgi:hypothetical protein
MQMAEAFAKIHGNNKVESLCGFKTLREDKHEGY